MFRANRDVRIAELETALAAATARAEKARNDALEEAAKIADRALTAERRTALVEGIGCLLDPPGAFELAQVTIAANIRAARTGEPRHET